MSTIANFIARYTTRDRRRVSQTEVIQLAHDVPDTSLLLYQCSALGRHSLVFRQERRSRFERVFLSQTKAIHQSLLYHLSDGLQVIMVDDPRDVVDNPLVRRYCKGVILGTFRCWVRTLYATWKYAAVSAMTINSSSYASVPVKNRATFSFWISPRCASLSDSMTAASPGVSSGGCWIANYRGKGRWKVRVTTHLSSRLVGIQILLSVLGEVVGVVREGRVF